MANGYWYNNPIFDYTISFTKRRLTGSITRVTGTPKIKVSTVNSRIFIPNPNRSPFVKNDIVVIQRTDRNWVDNWWQVVSVSGSSVVLKPANGQTSGSTFRITNPAASMMKITPGYGVGSYESPNETRRLSLFKYDTSLTGTKSPYWMCPMQRRVYTILKSFYSDPEVQAEYRAKWSLYSQDWWDSYIGPSQAVTYNGSSYQFNLQNVLDGFMCTVRGEATPSGYWDERAINPSNHRGLWQIAPSQYQEAWYDESALLNAEYSTRAALYLMFQRLFHWSVEDHSPTKLNPFEPWESAYYGPGRGGGGDKWVDCYTAKLPSPDHRLYEGDVQCDPMT